MGLIVFEVDTKGRKATKNLNRELLWYEWAPRDKDGKPIKDQDGNEIQGTMHRLNGGRLNFKYNAYEKKLNVGTAPIKITTYKTESNDREINRWIDANEVELKLSKAAGMGITVTFPDDKKEVVKKALEETEFTYEIV